MPNENQASVEVAQSSTANQNQTSVEVVQRLGSNESISRTLRLFQSPMFRYGGMALSGSSFGIICYGFALAFNQASKIASINNSTRVSPENNYVSNQDLGSFAPLSVAGVMLGAGLFEVGRRSFVNRLGIRLQENQSAFHRGLVTGEREPAVTLEGQGSQATNNRQSGQDNNLERGILGGRFPDNGVAEFNLTSNIERVGIPQGFSSGRLLQFGSENKSLQQRRDSAGVFDSNPPPLKEGDRGGLSVVPEVISEKDLMRLMPVNELNDGAGAGNPDQPQANPELRGAYESLQTPRPSFGRGDVAEVRYNQEGRVAKMVSLIEKQKAKS